MSQIEIKRRQIELGSFGLWFLTILIFGRILGDSGITYLLIALEAFGFFWNLSGMCLSDTLAKMFRTRATKGQYRNNLCIRRRMYFLQGLLSLLLGIVLAACAEPIAVQLFQVRHSALMIVLLAPVLFLRTISSVLLSYFQGQGTEFAAVVTAPLRQLSILGLGLIFAKKMGAYGSKVSALLGDDSYRAMYSGVGIALGILITELVILILLILYDIVRTRMGGQRNKEGMKQKDSFVDTIRVLYGTMWLPMLLCMLEGLPILLGAVYFRKSLSDAGDFAVKYGLYAGKYLSICGIIVVLICVPVLAMNAKTVSTYRKEDHRGAKALFQYNLHITVVNGMFGAAFVAVMAPQLSGMLCKSYGDVMADMFRYGSLLILLLSVFFSFSKLLVRMGRKYHYMMVLAGTNLIYIISLTILLKGGKTEVMSLVYAGLLALLAGVVALGFLCCKRLHTGIEWMRVLALPAGGACVAGLLCLFLGKIFTPHLGNTVTVIICFILSIALYWAFLLLCRNFTPQELKQIPGGKIIFAVGQTLKVF